MAKNFCKIYEYELMEDVRTLMNHSSKVKADMFKSIMMNRNSDLLVYKSFLSYINILLKRYEEYGFELSNRMKNCKGIENIKIISYDDIKNIIYAKYDYESLLSFVDGVMKASSEGNNKMNVEEFFIHVVTKAFKELPPSTAGILDSYIGDSTVITYKVSDKYESRLFESLKTYKMFNNTDRSDLYRNITSIMNMMSNYDLVNKYIKFANPKETISAISCIIEFITYSVTAYISRIYIIGSYLINFIYANEDLNTKPHIEFTERSELPSTEQTLDSVASTICRDLEDAFSKDINNHKELNNKLKEFIINIGCELNQALSNTETEYCAKDAYVNSFSNKLNGNALYNFLINGKYELFSMDNIEPHLAELHNILKSSIYNPTHAIEGSSSDRHEIIHTIKGASIGKTMKDVQNVSLDLYKFIRYIGNQISNTLNTLSRWSGDIQVSLLYNPTIKNDIADCDRMMREIYAEIALIVIQKFKDIEDEYNRLVSNKKNDIMNKLSLNLSNTKLTTDNTTNAASDATRIPLGIMDMYTMQAFESANMYNEYLREIFKDDIYFSEAFNFSSIIEDLKSLLNSGLQKLENFINDNKVKLCVKWINDNKEKFNSLDYNKVGVIKVLPYKENINIKLGLTKLISNASQYKNKDVKSYSESLYPNNTVYSWFTSSNTNDKKQKTGSNKYWNYICFAKSEAEVTDKPASYIDIQGDNISKYVNSYISTILSLQAAYNEIKKDKQTLDNIVNDIQKEIVRLTNEQKKNNNSNTADGSVPPNMNDNNQNNNNNNSDNNQTHTESTNAPETPGDNKSDNELNALKDKITALQLAISNLWIPIPYIVAKVVSVQYGYLKEIYNKVPKA